MTDWGSCGSAACIMMVGGKAKGPVASQSARNYRPQSAFPQFIYIVWANEEITKERVCSVNFKMELFRISIFLLIIFGQYLEIWGNGNSNILIPVNSKVHL